MYITCMCDHFQFSDCPIPISLLKIPVTVTTFNILFLHVMYIAAVQTVIHKPKMLILNKHSWLMYFIINVYYLTKLMKVFTTKLKQYDRIFF